MPDLLKKLCLTLLLVLVTLLPVRAEDDDPGDLLPLDSPIVIGGDHNYPPYEFLDEDGRPAGFNVELSRAIAEVMGMDIIIELGPWGEMRRGLADGRIDILQGMAWTRERTREVEFSTPHAMVHQSIWTMRGSAIDEVEELDGKKVIVMRGAVMHDYMLHRPEIDAQLEPVETLEHALRLLSSGEYDAALVAKLPGEYLIQKAGLHTIQPVARPIISQEYGYAVKKGNADLLARFNEGLVLLKKSGRYQPIYEKWLGVLPTPGVSWEKIIRIGALVVSPLVIVLVLTVLWSSTLKRQVALRTEALEREVSEKQRALKRLEVNQLQLIQADKLSSLGVLVSGVAHEVNNPNGLIMLNLPILKKVWADVEPLLEQHYRKRGDFKLGWLSYLRMRQEIPQMLEEMQQGSGRIKRIVEDLKDFARRDDAELDDLVDLNGVAEAALRLIDNPLKKATDHFRVELAPDLPRLRGNAQRIEQVVVNLLINACQALMSKEQAIALRTSRPSATTLMLEVTDQGRGVSPENLPKLTDPFFTTRRDAGGTGLGLSVSAGIVEEHGGHLEFSSRPGEGTRVRLILPVEETDE